jgi:cob(I)alamin adenosyltransferase
MRGRGLGIGYIQVYTGDGKGKTTAALGLALRASGHGMRTYIGQFMKGRPAGEHNASRDLPLITIEPYGEPSFVREGEVSAEQVADARRGLERARQAMLSRRYDIIVLDEVNVAIWFGVLTTEDVLIFLEQKPNDVEVVLTGRRAPQALIERADLATEFRPLKHYYDRGVPAREGIER